VSLTVCPAAAARARACISPGKVKPERANDPTLRKPRRCTPSQSLPYARPHRFNMGVLLVPARWLLGLYLSEFGYHPPFAESRQEKISTAADASSGERVFPAWR